MCKKLVLIFMLLFLLSDPLFSKDVDRAEIIKAFEREIKKESFYRDGVKIKITQIETRGKIKLPDNVSRYKLFLDLCPSSSFFGWRSGWVRVSSNGKEVLRIWAKAFVDGEILGVFAKRFIERGDIIKNEDVEERNLYLSKAPRDIVTSIKDVLGKVAKREIFPGSPITFHLLKKRLLVRRGKEVLIVYEDPWISATCKGIALEDGALGDFVKVENISSRKMIFGKVVGERKVKVGF